MVLIVRAGLVLGGVAFGGVGNAAFRVLIVACSMLACRQHARRVHDGCCLHFGMAEPCLRRQTRLQPPAGQRPRPWCDQQG